MSKRAVQMLTEVLAVEREALLAGDLEKVAALTEQKEALAAEFDDGDGRELAAISGALARNSALIAAARDGVATVANTLQQQRAARMTLSTYDKTGKPATISQPARGTERRF